DSLEQAARHIRLPGFHLHVSPLVERRGGPSALRIPGRDEVVYRVGRGRVPSFGARHERLADLVLRFRGFETVRKLPQQLFIAAASGSAASLKNGCVTRE